MYILSLHKDNVFKGENKILSSTFTYIISPMDLNKQLIILHSIPWQNIQ